MNRLGLRETDLVEKFVRSSGPGGQHVNKTSTCVYLKHLPSGIEVKIQAGRSQALNRFLARRAIVETLESQKGILSRADRRALKKKKQKARRKRRRRKFFGVQRAEGSDGNKTA